MTSRVNLTTFVNTALSNFQLNTSRMQTLQEQLASGKKINRPSDDPSGTRKVLASRAENLEFQQYTSNIQDAKGSVEFNTSILRDISDLLVRTQETTMRGVSDTADQDTKNALASEINQILNSLVQAANSKRLGKYVYSGTKTSTQPFKTTTNSNGDIDSVTYKGNREKIEYQIGPGMKAQVNQPGDEAFTDINLFDAIINIRDNLRTGSSASASAELDNINNAIDHLANLVSRAGGIASTLELSHNRINDAIISNTEIIGDTEGVDITEVVLRLKEQENVFQASLAAGSLIFKTSILDYL